MITINVIIKTVITITIIITIPIITLCIYNDN